MIDFAKELEIQSLEDHCLEKLNELLSLCFPVLLVHHINRATWTVGAEDIFKKGLKIFIDAITSFRWFIELANEEELDVDLNLAWKSLNKKAVLGILEEIKHIEEDDKQLILNGVKLWTSENALTKAEEDELLKKASDSEDDND